MASHEICWVPISGGGKDIILNPPMSTIFGSLRGYYLKIKKIKLFQLGFEKC